ncbi:unnamed protein product [Urochloa humidicola]
MDVAVSPRRRKRRRKQNGSARGLRSGSAVDAIPDDALELILLLLDSQVSLLRAASTCKRWRRIAAGDAFLRCFGSLHELPAVAGTYRNSWLLVRPPRFEPSPRPTGVDNAYFSLDFLHDNAISANTRWGILDSKGSLLFLEREDCNKKTRDFIVCEPLTRHQQIIPPPAVACPSHLGIQAFLLGGGGDNDAEPPGSRIGMSNFRVLCLVYAGWRSHAFVFTTGGSCWRAVNINSQERYHFIGFASRSLYWHGGHRTVFVMDKATAKFSSFLLPHVEDWGPLGNISSLRVTVAVGSDGETRIVIGLATGILKVFVRLRATGGEWALEKSIQVTAVMLGLRRLERWYFVHAVPGVDIQSAGKVRIQTYTAGAKRLGKFSIDMETMEVERLPDIVYMDRTYPTKLPWPPSMHACTHNA